MKKSIKRILPAIIVALAAISLSGCFNNVSGGSSEKVGDTVKPANVANIVYNVNSSKYSENVKEANLEDAIADVYTSVVYITNVSSSGTSVGCGVVADVSVNGESENIVYVYTCYHVVSDYTSLEVIFPDVPTYEDGGETLYDYGNIDYETYVFSTKDKTVGFVGGDFETDVAVLKVDIEKYIKETVSDGKTIEPIKVNKARITEREYKLGETVFAIGNPTGELKGTTTSGVVSYVNQDVTVKDLGKLTLLQFDTAINAGNSGGGLFNLYGELVGIVNAGSDSYENIGFAIPYKTSTPTRNDGDKDTGFVNIANKLIETAWNDGDRYNYGYVAGRWSLGLNVSTDSYRRPYVASIPAGSVFENSAVARKDYISGITYVKDGKTYSASFTETNYTAYTKFENFYNEMKQNLVAGDEITVVFKSGAGTKKIAVILQQKIYRDTGMKQAA